MEKKNSRILFLPDHIPSLKTTLMLSHTFINRLFMFTFMVLVGFCIAKSIQASSLLGLILAIVSLGAGIYFIYLLQQLYAGREQEQTI